MGKLPSGFGDVNDGNAQVYRRRAAADNSIVSKLSYKHYVTLNILLFW